MEDVVCCSWLPVRRQGEAGAADRRGAQQQQRGDGGIAIVIEAAGRAGGWTVVGGSDGEQSRIEEVLSHCRSLASPGDVRGCGRPWRDINVDGSRHGRRSFQHKTNLHMIAALGRDERRCLTPLLRSRGEVKER